MAHDHDHFHSKDDLNNYLVQQLFTIAISGALGAVSLSLYAQNKLKLVLAPAFHKWVLVGGIALLVLVVIRAIALWHFVGDLPSLEDHDAEHEHDHAHDHHHHGHEHHHEHAHASTSQAVTSAPVGGLSLNVLAPPAPTTPLPLSEPVHQPHHHDHDHDHDHDHACCGHDHDHDHDHDHAPSPAPVVPADDHGHDHDHGWAPWRMVLLMLPVVLYFLNLPNQVFADARSIDTSKLDLASKFAGDADAADFVDVSFVQLENAAMRPDLRSAFEGKTVELEGQYTKIDEQRFTLVRYKINCCATDALQLKAVIVIDPHGVKDPKLAKLNTKDYRNQWVRVTGRIQFVNRQGTNQYFPALFVTPTPSKKLSDLVAIIPQPANPWLN